MGVICFAIHKQYTSNTHSQYTNIEAVAVKSDRLLLFDFLNFSRKTFNRTVSVNTLGHIAYLMSDDEFQTVFINARLFCSCYKGMPCFVGLVL